MNSVTRQAIIDETERRGWTFETIGKELYKVTDSRGRSNIGRSGRFMGSSANGVYTSVFKELTYELIETFGYRLPPHGLYEDQEQARRFMAAHAPIVVKPNDAEGSRGVSTDIDTDEALDRAVALAAKESRRQHVVLQKQLEGRLYRVLVVGYRVFSVIYRRPVYVTGDGRRTVGELIDHKNESIRRSNTRTRQLTRIDRQNASSRLGATMDEVLAKGREMAVGSISSGEAEDVTGSIHPKLAAILEDIAAIMRLDVCGFDIITADIGVYDDTAPVPMLEVNSTPGYRLHLFPTKGQPRNPAPAVLDLAFAPTSAY